MKQKKMLTETIINTIHITNRIYEYLGKTEIIKILGQISEKSVEIFFDKQEIIKWIPLIIYKISLMIQKQNCACVYYTMYLIDINKIDKFFNRKIIKYFQDETVLHFDLNIYILEIEKIKCSIIYLYIIEHFIFSISRIYIFKSK